MTGEPYDFPQFIKRARERCGMSLSEAGELIQISKAHLWDMEKGNARNPSIVVLAGIACAYDLDLGVVAHLAAASAPGTEYRSALLNKRSADIRLVAVRDCVLEVGGK